MDIKAWALNMYPYWLLGIFVIFATIFAGYKDVVRVEKSAMLKWLKFLGIVTIYRVLLFKLFPNNQFLKEAIKNVTSVPWQITPSVFWEDACHGMPLFFIQMWLGTDKWWKQVIHALLLAVVMVEFGLGHVYQGVPAAIALSFYIPYSIKLGKKFGFGTVMLCHILFDLTTILTLKLFSGG